MALAAKVTAYMLNVEGSNVVEARKVPVLPINSTSSMEAASGLAFLAVARTSAVSQAAEMAPSAIRMA
jgi:hypothetical protein